jgi:glycosyltransferase involved in cell wall biosynthesis
MGYLFDINLIDVTIVRSNSIVYDTPRARRIGMSLAKMHSVLVLGWNREKRQMESIGSNNFRIELFDLKAPRGKTSIVAYLPLFWIWVLVNLFRYKPNVVHACDLDTVLPCLLYKTIFRKKLVFDVCDRYAMAYISPRLRTIYSIVNLLEEKCVTKADVLITVSEKLLKSFRAKPETVAVVMNCSDDKEISIELQDEKDNRQEIFRLVYVGTIVKNRGLEEIAMAIKDLDDVKLVMAGHILDKELFDSLVKMERVQYKGVLKYQDSINLISRSDVMMVLYDPKIPNNIFSCSNKIFEAMMCGLPIITNVSSDIIKDEVNCGLLVDYDDVNQIKSAIIKLRNNRELQKKFADNGRQAYLQKYNWKNMESKLSEIYEGLLSDQLKAESSVR